MLRNGLYLVADEAARCSGVEAAMKYRDALVLGSLREDVIALGAHFTEYPSFRHFGGRGLPGGYLPFVWPGPRRTVDQCYRRALARAREGSLAAAFVSLGRATHVITDACIPTHVHRVAHDHDPFEWSVEGNLDRLRALPIPTVTLPTRRASDLVRSLASAAAEHAPDRTNTPLGRVLRRLRLARRITAKEARAQTDVLLPLAIAHAAALLRMFARDTRS